MYSNTVKNNCNVYEIFLQLRCPESSPIFIATKPESKSTYSHKLGDQSLPYNLILFKLLSSKILVLYLIPSRKFGGKCLPSSKCFYPLKGTRNMTKVGSPGEAGI